MKFSEKNVRDVRKALRLFAMKTYKARAADGGIKMSAVVLGMATEIGVDRKTLKDFIEGTVAKPSSATMKKFDSWLSRHIVSTDNSAQPKAVAEDPRDKEIAALKHLITIKDQDREELRLKYVETRHQLEAIESVDPAHAEKYQAVHPENSYWMQNSEAYIKVYTHNDDLEDNRRLFTMPIPDLLEFIPRVESESHEEWKLRTHNLNEERKQLVIKLSEQIANLYMNCGFPDQYIGVDVVTSKRHIG